MKKQMTVKKVAMIASALLASVTVIPVCARHHRYIDTPFNTPFFDRGWVDNFFHAPSDAWSSMHGRSVDYGLSKEDKEALKAARENLAKVSCEVKEDDTSITLSLAGFESLDKKDIKVVKKEQGWLGTITLKEGIIEFFLTPQGIELSRRVECKKEKKAFTDTQGNEDQQKNNTEDSKEQCVFYSFSLATQVQYFKSFVDLSTLKAAPVTPAQFTLIVGKQKEEVLPLS